jgi:hypothetical protein
VVHGRVCASGVRVAGDGPVESAQQSATMSPGDRWAQPVDVSAANEAVKPGVSLAVAPNGDALAAWSGGDGVRVALEPVNARWQPPATLSPVTIACGTPDVAFGTGGRSSAAWASFLGANEFVQSANRTPQGGWQAPVDVFTGALPPHAPCHDPLGALDGAGNATAVWSVGIGRRSIVTQVAYRPASRMTWEAPIRLSAMGSDATDPQLAVNATGAALAG